MTELVAVRASGRADGAAGAHRSLQLDVFRALAAVFMIVNHAGNQLLWRGGAGDWPAALVFIGSAAPALFFFASGVGSGLSARAGEAPGAMLQKVVLLLLADMLLNWSSGNLWRFDFFGFAAVTTLVLFLVRRTRHPVAVASLLLALVVAARFGLVPFVRGRIPADSVLAFVTGIEPVRGVSYPLGPWLAFPLMGFLAGRRWRSGVTVEELGVAASTAVLGLVASALLAARGAPVFRWGSVSIAYFLCAIGIIAAAWLLADAIARWLPALSRAVALRGPTSLLIVPLHYGLLGLLEEIDPAVWSSTVWLVTTLLLACVVLLISRVIVAWAGRLAVPGVPAQALVAAVACGAAFAALLWGPPLVRLEVASLGEVAIGCLLLWSGRAATRKSGMASSGASVRLP